MAAEILSKEAYNSNLQAQINKNWPVDTTGPLFQPVGEGALPTIRQIGSSDRWKSYAPFHTFSVAEATVHEGKIQRVRLDDHMGRPPHDGVVVHGNERDYNIFTTQHYEAGVSVSTSIDVTVSENPIDELKIYYADSINHSRVGSDATVNIDIFGDGVGKAENIPFLKCEEEDEVTGFTYDLESERWYVNRIKAVRQELNPDQLEILRNTGFTIPISIRKNSVGLSVKAVLDGRETTITVPSGMPSADFFESFVYREPLTQFSFNVDGEERVSQVSGDEAKKWHDQVSKIALSKNEVDEHLTVTKQFDGGGCEASINEGGLFAHNHITLKKIQNEAQGVEDAYSLNHVYQRKVDRDEDDQLGVNVIENYNATDTGKILSDVYLKSDKGFAFRLRSEMLNGSRNFNHSFYMQLSEQNMTNLRINSKIALFAGDSEQNPSDHFYVEMTNLHSFELRKYSSHDMEGDYEVFDIDNNLLKDLFGFVIDPRDINIEGPVAHVGLSMRGHRYSVTVPSSFGGDVKTNLFEKGQSLVPMSIFTDAEGGWRDAMKTRK